MNDNCQGGTASVVEQAPETQIVPPILWFSACAFSFGGQGKSSHRGSHENDLDFARLLLYFTVELELLQKQGKIELMNQSIRQAQGGKGFSQIILLGIVAVIILGVAFGIVYFVRNDTGGVLSKHRCPWVFSPIMAAEPYYTGELYDAHLHLPVVSKAVSEISDKIGIPCPMWNEELSVEHLQCLFDSEKTSRAYGFHLLTKYSVTTEVKKAKEIEKLYPGMIVHFLMPVMVNLNINPDISAVRKALEDNPNFFRGLGELKMYDGKDPDDPYVLSLLDLAREYKLIVMMHPFNHHLADIEKIVRQYSDVTFLFHGIDYAADEGKGKSEEKDNSAWLKKLLTNNANVYYSIDGGLSVYGWKYEHLGKTVPKEEILPYIKSEFYSILELNIARYKNLIEAHSDRFLVGTDRHHRPHFDKEVSALMNEYSRAFIGRLTPSVQEKFAHENAEKLLKR